jgi:hypothetical protein
LSCVDAAYKGAHLAAGDLLDRFYEVSLAGMLENMRSRM